MYDVRDLKEPYLVVMSGGIDPDTGKPQGIRVQQFEKFFHGGISGSEYLWDSNALKAFNFYEAEIGSGVYDQVRMLDMRDRGDPEEDRGIIDMDDAREQIAEAMSDIPWSIL